VNYQPIQYTQEPDLLGNLSSSIAQFWEKGLFSAFHGKGNIRINYAAFILDPKAPSLIISQGRSESYLKYQELVYDLAQHGINIFLIDHRGQGLSQRMMNNLDKGYVKKFDDYANDLYWFTTTIVSKLSLNKQKPLLLAHSMGGAIAIRMMQLYPDAIKAALLSSPMVSINKGGLPNWLAKILIKSGNVLNKIFSNQAWYFIGQGNYQAKPFRVNELMQSEVRYQTFIKLYQDNVELQLGGVTIHWLAQAIETEDKIFSQLDRIKTPISVMQAGNDRIVDNHAQDRFCRQLHQLNPNKEVSDRPLVIKNALHELFFEKDHYRNQALNHVSSWLEQYVNE